MRYPNEKSIWEDLVFLCICFSRLPGWPWPPSSMQIQKPGTQGVENINTSLLLIRVSLPTSGSRGKWGAIAEVSFLWDKCHMGSVNKCDYVKGNSSTLILHTHGAIYTTTLQFHILAPDWSELCTIVEFDSIILWSAGEKRRWMKSIFEAFSENKTWK